ncbi:MAG: ArsB/NhaD family transporter [Nitrospira sp.]|nr:ArsB/NhaD family transporter [Nitrospira sp.]MDH4303832.1 ArsB/NhaD family transporter [Nitrospira sp.]MDH5193030.1 ArsB/NhaD family transporter [Nitrospira sp.]
MSFLTLALLIFGLCYLLIMTERLHKTIVALFGAAVMISLGVVSQEEAFYSHEFGVDYNVVFLLIGMMVIVNIVRETGLFEVLAIWAAQRADAKPFRLLVLLAVLTAALSAMLDNVTTVLLMAPVTLAITKRLELNPIPFLMTEALASNIGGTATLVGDPPNIMIASKAELSYLDFLLMLGPIVLIIMVLFLTVLWVIFGRTMTVAPHLREAVLLLSSRQAVPDEAFLRRCLILLVIVNVAFCFHSLVHLEPATIALLGASLFMVIGHARRNHEDAEELTYLAEVEWKTIFFFIGLFILVGGLVKVGVIRYLADQLVSVTRGNLAGTTMTVLWGSAVLSAVVDNIPYVAAMNPLIVDLARSLHPEITDYATLVHQADIIPLWWALALGACLGGNGTIIGASANVVIVDLARKAGYRITFWQFFKYGFPVMLGSVALSAMYLWVLFLR